jgi:hypothetical protein
MHTFDLDEHNVGSHTIMSTPKQDRKRSTKTTSGKDVTQSRTRFDPEAGGVRLAEYENGMPERSTATAAKRKRRPKKITDKVEEKSEATAESGPALPTDVTVEVNVLKSKVQEIEAQVQEILLRPTSQAPTKSARRRTRHQKTSALADVADVPEQAERDSDQGADSSTVELHKLQEELEVAQEDLIILKQRKDKKHAPSMHETGSSVQADNEDDIEDIPRTHNPGLVEVQRPRPLGRSVTLTGAYRLPIPMNVSDAELDAISKGIKSAQNIARSFLDASAGSKRSSARPAQDSSAAQSSGSWSKWIGGYSMSIAKAVDKVRISSSMETVPERPAIAARSETAPPVRRKPQKLEMRSKKRSDMPKVSRKLSDQQVEGLLA